MNKIIKYVAVDGTEFDCESDCIDYEINLNKPTSNGLILFDIDGTILPNTPRNLEECSYIKIEDETALMWANRIENIYGCYSPSSIGSYYYDYDKEEWCEISEILTKAKNIIKIFNIKFME